MKKRVIKTTNGHGDKCKTYAFISDDAIVFQKYTLVKIPTERRVSNFVGGEEIIRKGNGYFFTYHWFSIKRSTLNNLIFE
jgi:hypothetical protein